MLEADARRESSESPSAHSPAVEDGGEEEGLVELGMADSEASVDAGDDEEGGDAAEGSKEEEEEEEEELQLGGVWRFVGEGSIGLKAECCIGGAE